MQVSERAVRSQHTTIVVYLVCLACTVQRAAKIDRGTARKGGCVCVCWHRHLKVHAWTAGVGCGWKVGYRCTNNTKTQIFSGIGGWIYALEAVRSPVGCSCSLSTNFWIRASRRVLILFTLYNYNIGSIIATKLVLFYFDVLATICFWLQ